MPRRTFFSVGNGLFAMEETDGIHSVYDCGGQNQKFIDNAIDKAIKVSPAHIDNLFISHYHKDHVNGLSKLLRSFNVDRIFLPMIPNLTRVLNYSITNANYYFAEFILNPHDFIHQVSPETKIIEINSDEQVEQNDNVTKLEDVGSYTVLNGKVSICSLHSWHYIIYNRRTLSDSELASFMKTLGLDINSSIDDIIATLRSAGGNTLLESLRNVFTPKELALLNDYSMTVWSGRAVDDAYGCFFTGDYNAKLHYNDLNMVYRHYLPISQIIQIPHHGSINNFDESICQQPATHVISASSGPYNGRQIVNPNKVISILNRRGYKEEDTRNGNVIL